MAKKKSKGVVGNKSKNVDYGKLILILAILFVVVLVFTFFDYLVHNLSENYAVPSYYFRNKIIFATLYSWVIYYFIRNKNPVRKALIISSIVVVLLQVRYFYEGYNLSFVIEFLFIHFGILFLLLLGTFKFLNKWI